MKNFLFAGLLLLACACQPIVESPTQLEPVNPTATQAEISAHNGRLIFKSQEVFDAALYQLLTGKADLDIWENQFEGFHSMRNTYQQLTEAEQKQISERGLSPEQQAFMYLSTDEFGDLEAHRIISTLGLSTLANEKGVYQIGDQVFRHYQGQVAQGTYENEDQIVRLTQTPPSDLDPAFELKEVIEEKLTSSFTRNGNNLCTSSYTSGGRDYRFRNKLTHKVVSIYNIHSTSTKHQRRRFGIWWAFDADEIRIQVTGSATCCNVTHTVNYDSGVSTDTNEVEATAFDCQQCGVLDSHLLNGVHTNVGVNGTTYTCNTSDW